MGGATSAAVIMGAQVPIVLTSRADNEQSKLMSIALANLLSWNTLIFMEDKDYKLHEENIRILAINPGSTSTKIAVYQNTNPIFIKNIKHSEEDLQKFDHISDQYPWRKQIICDELKQADIRLDLIKIVLAEAVYYAP